MEERYKCAIVVDLMLKRLNKENGNQEILLMLRKNTGYNDGMYELPGGHVDEGEDLINAIINVFIQSIVFLLTRLIDMRRHRFVCNSRHITQSLILTLRHFSQLFLNVLTD